MQIKNNIEKIKEKQNANIVQHAREKSELIEQLQSIFQFNQSMNETKKIKKTE